MVRSLSRRAASAPKIFRLQSAALIASRFTCHNSARWWQANPGSSQIRFTCAESATKAHQNGCAPPGALLATLWGDEPFAGKLRLHLSSEAVRTLTGLLLGAEYLAPLSSLPQVLGVKEHSLPHTVFSSAFSLGVSTQPVKVQLDRSPTMQSRKRYNSNLWN